MKLRSPLLIAVALAGASPAWAADVAANAGAIEVLSTPGPVHAGLYPYLGASVAFAVPHATLIAGLSLEWSFDQGRGGLVASFTADFAVNDWIGLDLNLALIHDQPGLRFSEALFFLGGGPGFTIFLGKWAVSPSFSLFAGLNAAGAAVVPGVNVSRTF